MYLLSDPNGPLTAFLQFRPQCTVGVLAGTHWGALRCPGRLASGTKRQLLSAALLYCCCTAEPVLTRVTQQTPSVKHTCRGFWPMWMAPTTVFVTFTPFMLSVVSNNDDNLQLFKVVFFIFITQIGPVLRCGFQLPSTELLGHDCHELADVIPDFSDVIVDDLLNDTIGNSVSHNMLDHLNGSCPEDVGQERRRFLQRCTREYVPLESTRSPLQFPSESTELAQQHSSQQRVRNLIRARDTVLVASEPNPSGDIFTLSTLLRNVEISLIIILFTVSPSNCMISSSWSPLHVTTQFASSMGQATLIAFSFS